MKFDQMVKSIDHNVKLRKTSLAPRHALARIWVVRLSISQMDSHWRPPAVTHST
jgi:hypothetical protein